MPLRLNSNLLLQAINSLVTTTNEAINRFRTTDSINDLMSFAFKNFIFASSNLEDFLEGKSAPTQRKIIAWMIPFYGWIFSMILLWHITTIPQYVLPLAARYMCWEMRE